MNAITRALVVVESKSPSPIQMTAYKECPEISDEQLRKLEADRVFEAGVQWFLAVSRSA